MVPKDLEGDPPTLRRDPDDPQTVFQRRADSAPVDPGAYDAPANTTAAYTFGELIGRGGMGEVVSAHDRRIGRDVAVKRLNADHPTDDDVSRFLREARIQARLDHPAIVPVHEVGRDASGRPYFAMKRLTGMTLAQQLPKEGPGSQRLLRAFAEVCLAIEFAHMRGIVHRDLKPSNIMLGDYGEVYVLDWGLARVLADGATEVVTTDLDSLDGTEAPSQLLGTPGYIAPEQLHSSGEVGRPVDVYALGSMLFEILTRQPLHPRNAQAAIASTLNITTVVSPAQRFPDRGVPPELDALCAAALSIDATARPSAREIAERVQAFLDGDRDLARRKGVATEQLWKARALLTEGHRGEAMRAAGRALAIDPECAGAAELVTMLMLEPPKEIPIELEASLRAADHDSIRKHARTAVIAYVALASFLPIAMWNGIRKWPPVLAVFFVALALASIAWQLHRRPKRNLGEMLVYAVGNALLLALMSRMAGPFSFVPALACFISMSVMAYPAFIERSALLIAIMIAGFVVPLYLESRGVLATTWEIRDNMLISHAGALSLDGPTAVVLVIGASVVTIVMAGIHGASLARTNRRAQRQLVIQAWHLRQLLPATPATASTAASATG